MIDEIKAEIRANQEKMDANLKEIKEEIKANKEEMKEEMKTDQAEIKAIVNVILKKYKVLVRREKGLSGEAGGNSTRNRSCSGTSDSS
jgi:hypothetical protein